MLNTRIIKKETGSSLELKWGWWHVETMAACAALDEGLLSEEEYTNLKPIPRSKLHSTGRHVVTTDRRFEDPTDGEVLDLVEGDTLEMWRTS